MSYFEKVFVKLQCERCGRIHDAWVMFRSYVGQPDGEYHLLEVAAQRDGLPTGEVWEGNGDRYCWNCFQRWALDQIYAGYEALAELIEKELVTVRAEGSTNPLPPSAIKAYAEDYANELLAEGGGLPVTMPYFEELDLTIGPRPYNRDDLLNFDVDESRRIAANEIWTEFLNLIDPLINERMVKKGWLADGCTWEDFRVSLDDERRVVVEDMQGKRLMRDGARLAQ